MEPLFKLCVVLFFFGLSSAASYSTLVNRNVNRNIDITTQIARHAVFINFENDGSSPVSNYELIIPESLNEHLSLLTAQVPSGDYLKVSEVGKDSQKGQSFAIYRIELASPVQPNSRGDILILASFTNVLFPFPTHITQTDPQLVRYFDNHYFWSPYKTDLQTTIVVLPSSAAVESKTELSPTSLKDKKITYGPYSGAEEFSQSQMVVHYQNQSPFVVIDDLTKEIEVSFWGNIAVTEYYNNLRHAGAILDGSFSRFDYQRNPAAGQTAIPILVELLPVGAADVYYRDDIGNISTSHVSETDEGSVKLEVIPRFPLFGGWKTSYYIGYNLPLEFHLFSDASDSSSYVLNITFSADMPIAVIKKLNVRFILPEGVSDVQVHAPFSFEGPSFSKRPTYLDVSGRQVVDISKSNVIVDHNQNIQVTFRFSGLSMLQEPLLLIISFFFLFLTAFFFSRFELKIAKSS